MREFMFFIRKANNNSVTMPADKHQEFLKACETYIGELKQEGKLLSAQPIVWEGKIIAGKGDTWKEAPINESGETIGGYYHILAADLDEAIKIAKANPEFQYNEGTRIEVRPLKMKETTTGFVYPSKKN
jgi:hypothetical protein